MKKVILALVALVSMTAAQAQDDNQQKRERRPMDQTEMVKQRTDDIVKKYGLDNEQAGKLLSLNTKYADKMGRGFGGRRGFGGQRPGQRQGQRPEMTEEMRQQMETARKEQAEAMKQYDEELQTILTPEQYKAYKADQEQRMRQGGRRGGGPRGNRPERNQE
jgi:Spy/CpxP family protein refolding chaperone